MSFTTGSKLNTFQNYEAQHVTLVASTDTTITFSQSVKLIRVSNWSTTNILLVSPSTIASDTPATGAGRIGLAPATNVPNSDWFPQHALTLHLRAAGANPVTVEAWT